MSRKMLFIINEWAMSKCVDAQNMFDDKQGLTGSETSIVMFAEAAYSLGNDVTLFGNFKEETTWRGVKVKTFQSLQSLTQCKFDVVFSWIHPEPLKFFSDSIRVFNQQVNDFHYCAGWEEYVDIITSPSQAHKKYLMQFSNFPETNWKVLPNCCDPSVFFPSEPVFNKKLIYASSPDRGLHWLLEAFPKIKKHVPDVTLDVFYDWDLFFERFKALENETAQRLRFCNEMFERLKSFGVKHNKSVSKNEMAKILKNSQILAYPCDPVCFTEGFSVTTLEAAASGCLPVICGADALQSIYEDYTPVVKAPFSCHKQEYIDIIVEMLLDKEKYLQARQNAVRLSSVYEWKKVFSAFQETCLNNI